MQIQINAIFSDARPDVWVRSSCDTHQVQASSARPRTGLPAARLLQIDVLRPQQPLDRILLRLALLR